MELFIAILQKLFENEKVEVSFPNLKLDLNSVFEQECFKTLQKIKAAVEDESLDDSECFKKIEEIICIFEHLGSDGGGRHDFG